ncbi:CotO family spore coat protein [Bacillus fonticola]|uniref:CotO family spore coat protein n=1 Tax=Bacillus fonticola TaxID=2728853 RepID=UPI001474ED32|nr:CotO family spore coat protein [Bacillus fonticola]
MSSHKKKSQASTSKEGSHVPLVGTNPPPIPHMQSYYRTPTKKQYDREESAYEEIMEETVADVHKGTGAAADTSANIDTDTKETEDVDEPLGSDTVHVVEAEEVSTEEPNEGSRKKRLRDMTQEEMIWHLSKLPSILPKPVCQITVGEDKIDVKVVDADEEGVVFQHPQRRRTFKIAWTSIDSIEVIGL